ncbi:uncharacterized protein E0L32_008907 [Thyridium curvatum]|uniref:Sulfatase N-terminal domain-containing protein n=1 Tax=Thyridium curvatum TaxID=1093900 RepID=A0A507AIC8_9PEZI|nr:uncharacterized protein E0L32_008907 [Thyridium curvatum]TPX09885.1 hypothetical protein E0L32_008907 [Thyridium curvatum]
MSATKRPNFLVIVADDLGFSDTGPFGSEIKTPALDRIAKEGVRLTNFHTASACSPTRSMLFSGSDNHIAGLGQMAEHMGNRELFKDKPGYEGYLNFRVAALSEILQDAGYLTMMSGKWHLGAAKEHAPCSRGFDKGFVYLPGSGNHYNYEPQFKEGQPRPSLAVADPKTFWMRDGVYLDRRTELPEDFYSTKTFTDELINYLNTRTDEEKEKPFFSYLAYTAPHWPLHAPKEVIEKYKGVYDDGPAALRKKRLERMIELGLVPKDVEPAPMVGLLDPEWETMTAEERALSARKMETFAAMVDVVDQNIQRVLDALEASGELDNTFIVFMSDNGAEGTLLEALPMLGGATSLGALIETHYNNELANIGNRDSFTWYGASWACASMAPSRGFKTWITEGGIRCPCLVRFPPVVAGAARGTHTNTFTTVMDVLPTFLELAGVAHPAPSFRGREVVPVRGKSWVGHLRGADYAASPAVHDEDTAVTGWELFGLRAIREGKWKAIYMTPPRGNEQWELYDMEADPGEIHDRAGEEPEVLERLVQHWNVYYNEVGMFDPDVTFHVVKDKRVEVAA